MSAPGYLVSDAFLSNQRLINGLVRFNLGQGGASTYPTPQGATRADVRLVRTPADGIKGAKYVSPVIYGADCDCVEIIDSTDMTDPVTKLERRLQYLKAGTTRATQFVLNPHVNPVPGHALVTVERGVGAEYFVIGHEWELPAVVSADFSEPDAYNTPKIATVNVLASTGDAPTATPGDPVYVVTDYTLKVVVRGQGVTLDKGTPCRVKTVCGVWMFSWIDCAVDDDLKADIAGAGTYPDFLEPV